ncbi:hypothetical protein Tco_1435032 [Tanacetum coccineum]
MNEKEESSDDERSLDSLVDEQEDYEHVVNIGADVNSNYNPYLDISRVFIDHRRRSEDEIVQDETELNNDEGDDMGHLDDHLVHENEPFIINVKECMSRIPRYLPQDRRRMVRDKGGMKNRRQIADTAYPTPMDTTY